LGNHENLSFIDAAQVKDARIFIVGDALWNQSLLVNSERGNATYLRGFVVFKLFQNCSELRQFSERIKIMISGKGQHQTHISCALQKRKCFAWFAVERVSGGQVVHQTRMVNAQISRHLHVGEERRVVLFLVRFSGERLVVTTVFLIGLSKRNGTQENKRRKL
jgi:hypothetical protein